MECLSRTVEKADISALDEILNSVIEGKELTPSDVYALIEAPSELIPRVAAVAASIRDASKGRTVTYSRKVFLPLSNLCRNACAYCTFYKLPGQPGAKTMSPAEVVSSARKAEGLGCKEALFSLGEKPELAFEVARAELRSMGFNTIMEYLRYACELVLRETKLLPHSNPGTMSRKELEMLRPFNASVGMMLENVSERLMESGGAHEFAPDKHPRVRLATIRNAGLLKIPFTTGLLIGIGETRRERVDSLFALRGLHDEYGHIQEIIIQNFRAKPDTPMRNWPEPSEEEMVRTIAVARLIFRGSTNIQAPPNLAPGSWASYLSAGINDWGGISPLTIDYINPEAPWPHVARLRSECESLGFRLRERLAVYPEYVRKEGYLDGELRRRAAEHVDAQGYVRGELAVC